MPAGGAEWTSRLAAPPTATPQAGCSQPPSLDMTYTCVCRLCLQELCLLHTLAEREISALLEGAEYQEPTQAYGWARREEKVQPGLMYFCRRKVAGCSVTAMLRSEVEGDG